MNNFASFSEDPLPRSIPLPSVDPRTLSLKANAAVPSVPELSMLNYAAPVQPPVASKPISYSAWKKEHNLERNGNQPQQQPNGLAVQRKTVSFDSPMAPCDLPAAPNGIATSQAVVVNDRPACPKLCSQLELSTFEPALPSSYSDENANQQLRNLRQEMVNRVNGGFDQQAVTLENNNNVCDSNAVQQSIEDNLLPKRPEPTVPDKPDLAPIVMELIRQLCAGNNTPHRSDMKENINPAHTVSPAPAPAKVLSPIKENIPETAEPSLKEIHQLIVKQQEEILLLRKQVNHLLQIQENYHQLPVPIDNLPQTNKTQQSPDAELALGEDAFTLSHQHQTPQPHQHQFHRRHHNSPADWKFYGNTLEQVAHILQNAPPPRSSPSSQPRQQPADKQSPLHDATSSTAQQRVTFATANHFETPKQPHERPTRSCSLPAPSDRSMAMNNLALKYLPDHHTGNGYEPAGPALNGQSPVVHTNPRRSKSPDMSAMTLDYLHKYGLMTNQRLFDE